MTATGIRLASGRLVPAEQVYFTFGSGRLAYDCVRCGAKCCRGFGYLTAGGKELERQIAQAPALRFFVTPLAGTTSKVINLPPACFFLGHDGLCQIQKGAGYQAKPETCRLFPFNEIRECGGYLIVSPHSGLCPLQLVRVPGAAAESRHDGLIDAMVVGGVSVSVREARCVDSDIKRVIGLERKVCELSETMHDRTLPEFVAAQLFVAAGGSVEDATANGGSRFRPEIERQLRLCADMLGCDVPSHVAPDDLDALLIALTPYLRRRLIFADVDGVKPDQPAPTSPDRAPFHILSIYFLVKLAEAAGMDEITFQTVTKIDGGSRDLVALMRDADRALALRPDAMVDLLKVGGAELKPFIRITRALLPSVQRNAGRNLAEIITSNTPFQDLERVSFLRTVSKRLGGRLESAADALPARRSSRIPLRVRLQRLGLQVLPDEAIEAVAARRQSRARI